MTEKITLVEFDGSTGLESIRELTEQELLEREEIANQAQLAKQEYEAKANSRTSALAKLAALGLTEEEIAAL